MICDGCGADKRQDEFPDDMVFQKRRRTLCVDCKKAKSDYRTGEKHTKRLNSDAGKRKFVDYYSSDLGPGDY